MTSSFVLNLPLAHVALDRDYLARERDELFAELWSNSSTLILPMHRGQVLLGRESELKYLSPELIPQSSALAYLGKVLEIGTPIVVARLDDAQAFEFEPDSSNWHTLRRSGIGLSPTDAAVFTQALALFNWHETHAFCPVCGTRTEITRGGWVRRCPSDDRELFPRTDPAIIVSVIDEHDRILLGSQGVWEDNRFSILAGFVEPGESLEAAVVREMQEEAGIKVASPKYLGSQAWPFPYSLMLGYTATYVGGEVTPDGEEIVKLRWFTREELKAEALNLLLPGKLSIARAIIEHWLGEELQTGE
jgi:NAD+ diphosphatase